MLDATVKREMYASYKKRCQKSVIGMQNAAVQAGGIRGSVWRVRDFFFSRES
jgi:hypothetical protein